MEENKQRESPEKREIRELDIRILNILLDDSRLSYRQLAKKAGVSVATAMNHVKGLEKEGVIKGYTATVNYDRLGFDIDVIVSVKVSKGKLFAVENRIAAIPNVVEVYDVTGDFDCVVVAKFKNRRLLDNFLKKIQTFEFVERTSTVMILNTIKSSQMRL